MRQSLAASLACLLFGVFATCRMHDEPSAGRELPANSEKSSTDQTTTVVDFPSDFEKALIEAALRLSLKEYRESLAWLESATAVSRADEAIRLILMGQCLEGLNSNSRAMSAYEKALSIAPDVAVSTLRLGVLEYRLGDLERAKVYVERYVALEPGNPEAFYYLYSCYFAEDNPVQMARCLRKVIALDGKAGIWSKKLAKGPAE